MRKREIRQEYRTLSMTLHAIGAKRFWGEFTEFLRAFMSFDELLVLSYPARSAPYCSYHTLDPSHYAVLIADYCAGPYILDPFYTIVRHTDRAGAVALRDAAPDKFRASKYYERHYWRTGIVDELGLFIRTTEDHCDVVSLLRTGTSRRFSPGEFAQFHNRSSVLLYMGEAHLRAARTQPEGAAGQKRHTFAEALEGERLNLSPREVEIAELILRGQSSLSIALNLNIVEGTVKNHRKSIYRKLGISSQAELFS
ncbi:MAG: LuxR C-terminal-related transcriptional regulator, partial [Pikeienuella sp.]